MTINEYYQKLELADWHYQMSDDSNTYYRGRQEQAELIKAAENNPEFKKLYKAFFEYHFSGPAFGNERAPYPNKP